MSSRYFAQLKPLPGQLAGRTLTLSLEHLPGKRALQAKGAPWAVCWDILGLEFEQEQIRHDRYGHGAFHPVHLLCGEYCLSNDLLLCFPSLFIVTRALGGGET